MDWNYILIQSALTVFSAIAIILLNLKNERLNFVGAVAGCFGQPFWFYTALFTEPKQWGVFIMAFIYSFAYLMGVWNFRKAWFKK